MMQGTVPADIVETYGGEDWKRLAALLVEVRLWDIVSEGVWRFHDFREWQGLALRERKAEGGRKGARTRWPDSPLWEADDSPNGELVGSASDSHPTLNNPHPTPPHPTPTPHPPPTNAQPDGFAAFYLAYPKHEERRRAERAWPRAVERAGGVPVIMAGLARYVAHLEARRTERKFIKQPPTWLNGDCWQDEYDDDEDTTGSVDPPWL